MDKRHDLWESFKNVLVTQENNCLIISKGKKMTSLQGLVSIF